MPDILPNKTDKPWGYEILYALTDKYAGKILSVNKGQRLSLQYHREKDESMYLFQGEILLQIGTPEGQMENKRIHPGQSIRIPPNTKHRIEALENSLLLEVSTHELCDVVRLKDDYGRLG